MAETPGRAEPDPAGALTNLVVAWVAIVSGASSAVHGVFAVGSDGDDYREVLRTSGLGAEVVISYVRTGSMWVETTPYPGRPWWPPEPFEDDDVVSCVVGAGWPMLALTGWQMKHSDPAGSPWIQHRALRWERADGRVLLPLQPLWSGFLVNTVFYAAICLVLYCGSRFAHARVRSWRGGCPNCGYPRGESSTCPECGAAVKPLVTTAPMVEWHALREKGPEA